MTNTVLGGLGSQAAAENQLPINNAKDSLSSAIIETTKIVSELAKRLDAITHPSNAVALDQLEKEEIPSVGSRATLWLKMQANLVKSTNDQLRILLETIEL